MSIKETPEERDRRLALERDTRELATMIARRLRAGAGFALFIFDFGPGGAMAYVSNAERADMIQAVKEWLATQERRS